jgi:hypothetical protein
MAGVTRKGDLVQPPTLPSNRPTLVSIGRSGVGHLRATTCAICLVASIAGGCQTAATRPPGTGEVEAKQSDVGKKKWFTHYLAAQVCPTVSLQNCRTVKTGFATVEGVEGTPRSERQSSQPIG